MGDLVWRIDEVSARKLRSIQPSASVWVAMPQYFKRRFA